MNPFSNFEPLCWLLGMLAHVLVRGAEWRQKHPGASVGAYFRLLLQREIVLAKVVSLAMLAFWMSDFVMRLPGTSFSFRPSEFLPHGLLMSFVLGYVSDSLAKHVILYLRDRGLLKNGNDEPAAPDKIQASETK